MLEKPEVLVAVALVMVPALTQVALAILLPQLHHKVIMEAQDLGRLHTVVEVEAALEALA